MNTIPTKSTKSLFIGVVIIIALLAGFTHSAQPSKLTAKKECVGLTQDGIVTMLVERGEDGCKVDLSKTLFFTNNPTCDVNDPKHKPHKVQNIETLGDVNPICMPIEGLCNDCVKWTIGSSPETIEWCDETTGECVVFCYDIWNALPLGCLDDPDTCESYYCIESVRDGNCTGNDYYCVPDEFDPTRSTEHGKKCSTQEECMMENGDPPWCLWPWNSPRTCKFPWEEAGQ